MTNILQFYDFPSATCAGKKLILPNKTGGMKNNHLAISHCMQTHLVILDQNRTAVCHLPELKKKQNCCTIGF